MHKKRRHLGLNEISFADVGLKSENQRLSKKISLKEFFTTAHKDERFSAKFSDGRRFSAVTRIRLKSRGNLARPESTPLLVNRYKGEVPAVGTYDVSQEWIKPSFSNKNLQYNPVESSLKPLSMSKCETPQTPIKRIRRYAHSSEKSKNSLLPIRKKGIWEDLKVYGTPESMKTVFSFKSEMRQLLEYQLNITRGLEKLREITLGDKINYEEVHYSM